jgi:hypothetical protein
LTILLAGFVLPAAFQARAGDVYLPAEKILEMARTKAHQLDSGAWLVRAEYTWGNRDLNFKRGGFVFNSTKLKSEGGRFNSLSLSVNEGKVATVREVIYSWMEKTDLKALPHDAVKVALQAGLGAWWTDHQAARLFVEIRPRSKQDDFKPGSSQ